MINDYVVVMPLLVQLSNHLAADKTSTSGNYDHVCASIQNSNRGSVARFLVLCFRDIFIERFKPEAYTSSLLSSSKEAA